MTAETQLNRAVRPFRALMRAVLCVASAVIVASVAAAAGDLRPGIIGADDRVRVEEAGPPFDAVGQVNIGGYRSGGQCTGTLIAPDLVLTAAHCVVNAAKGAPHPLKDIHFLAGVRGESHKGHAKAKCLRLPPGHAIAAPDRRGHVPIHAFFKDAAVIVLDRPLDVTPAKVAAAAAGQPGQRLTHAAYPADRRFALTVHKGCKLLAVGRDGPLWLNDCDTYLGVARGVVGGDDTGLRLPV